jgi:hypothetical protein
MTRQWISLLLFASILLITGCKKNQDIQTNEEDVYKEKLMNLLNIDRSSTKPSNIEKDDFNFKTWKDAFLFFKNRKKTSFTLEKTSTVKPTTKSTSDKSAIRTLDPSSVFVQYPTVPFSFSRNVTMGVNPAQLDFNFSVSPLINYYYSYPDGYGPYQLVNMYIDNINYTYSSTESCSLVASPDIDYNSFQMELQQSYTFVVNSAAYTAYALIHIYGLTSVYANVPSPDIPNITVSASLQVSF